MSKHLGRKSWKREKHCKLCKGSKETGMHLKEECERCLISLESSEQKGCQKKTLKDFK